MRRAPHTWTREKKNVKEGGTELMSLKGKKSSFSSSTWKTPSLPKLCETTLREPAPSSHLNGTTMRLRQRLLAAKAMAFLLGLRD